MGSPPSARWSRFGRPRSERSGSSVVTGQDRAVRARWPSPTRSRPAFAGTGSLMLGNPFLLKADQADVVPVAVHPAAEPTPPWAEAPWPRPSRHPRRRSQGFPGRLWRRSPSSVRALAFPSAGHGHDYHVVDLTLRAAELSTTLTLGGAGEGGAGYRLMWSRYGHSEPGPDAGCGRYGRGCRDGEHARRCSSTCAGAEKPLRRPSKKAGRLSARLLLGRL